MGTTASFIEAEFLEGMYDSFYRRSSAIAHGQPYVTVSNGRVDARRTVWQRLSAGPAMMADLLMVKLLGTVIREFKLGLDDRMVSLLKDTKAITRENMNKLGKEVGLSDEELLQ